MPCTVAASDERRTTNGRGQRKRHQPLNDNNLFSNSSGNVNNVCCANQIRRALCPERVRSKLFDVSGVMFDNVQSARPLDVLSSFFDWCALGPMSMCSCFLGACLVLPWCLLGASLVPPRCLPGASLHPLTWSQGVF